MKMLIPPGFALNPNLSDKLFTILLGLLFSILLPHSIPAQSFNWSQDFALVTGFSASYMHQADIADDGSILTAGESWLGQNWLARFDEQGNVLYAGAPSGLTGHVLHRMVAGPLTTFGVVGNNGQLGTPDAFITRLDSNGQVISTVTYPWNTYRELTFTNYQRLPSGQFLAAGHQRDGTTYRSFALLQDTNFVPQWIQFYAVDSIRASPVAACEDGLGGFFLVTSSGDFENSLTTYDEVFHLLHLNALGDSLWQVPVPAGFGTISDMLLTVDGDLLLTGAGDSTQSGACPPPLIEDRALLMKIDSTGNFLARHALGNCNFSPVGILSMTGNRYSQQGISLDHDGNGDITWTGVTNHQRLILPSTPPWSTEVNDISPFVGKLDSAGNFLYQFPLTGSIFSEGYRAEFLPIGSGDLLQIWFVGGGVNGSNFLQRTSPYQPFAFSNNANLQVHYVYDSTGDCQADGTPPMPEFVTELSPNLYPCNQSIGQTGYFNLPDGAYQVRMAPTNPYWQQSCPGTNGAHQILMANDTFIDLTIGVEPTVECPLLTVDMSNFILRPCSPSQYRVRCQNLGSSIAMDTRVVVELDPLLTLQITSIPWTALPNNAYEFELGNLLPGADTSFIIHMNVDCNAQIGMAICSDAHITPDSFCLPSPIWDGASLDANVWCNPTQDTVFFEVRNVGSGAMAIPGNILVLEDNVMKHNFSHSLNAGEDTTLWELANGATWYLQAEQTPGHPGSNIAADVLEGCGTDSSGNFSTGFAATVPLSDWDYYQFSTCDIVTSSYDPNDKRGFPLGAGPNHYIDSTTLINYVIRFQNTGTDTAFNILIIDTLPPELDGYTFQAGASSHPYTTTFGPNGVIRFHFENINLPDTSAGILWSEGFVQFRIRQVDGNLPNTVISNDADIYFDFNAPITTDPYFHTIEPEWMGTVSLEEAMPSVELSVGPNPFREVIRFRLDQAPHEPGDFALYDLYGKLILRQTITDLEWQVNGSELPQGVYLFRYTGPDGAVAEGKIIRFSR